MGLFDGAPYKIAGVSGLIFVAALIAVSLIADPPTYDSTAAQTRALFVASDTQVHLTTWLLGTVFVFVFPVFAAGVRDVLCVGDGLEDRMWARLSYTGAVLVTVIGLVAVAFWEVLSQGMAEQLSDASLVTVARLDTVFLFGLMPLPMALFVGAASVGSRRSLKIVAGWIWWVGVSGAVALVAGTLWIFTENDESAFVGALVVGVLAVLLWIVLVSVEMIRFSRAETSNDIHASGPFCPQSHSELERTKIIVLAALAMLGSLAMGAFLDRARYGISFNSEDSSDASAAIFAIALFWSVWWAIRNWPTRHDRLRRWFEIVAGFLFGLIFTSLAFEALSAAGFFFFSTIAFAHIAILTKTLTT